jgi:hypothetical protein
MILEEQRFLHEDLERLEQGISERVAEEPRHVSSSFMAFNLVGTTNILHRLAIASIETIKFQASSIVFKISPSDF